MQKIRLSILLLVSILCGCGTGNFDANTNSDRTSEKNSRFQEPTASEIVDRFLHAMLHGENETVRDLLTETARKKGAKYNVPFAPSASETASYRIEKTVPQGEIGAYVHSVLTDLDEHGRSESAEIVWIVAKTEAGWRIAGAAVSLFAGQEKTVINFEDPEAAQNAIAAAVRDFAPIPGTPSPARF